MNYPLLYLEHLTDEDLSRLAAGSEQEPGHLRRRLREDPTYIDRVLSRPGLFERLVAVGAEEALEVRISPFLTFTLLVHQAAREVEELDFIQEWTGPRQRLPVFDVVSLREFLEEAAHRFYLAQLLASYTRVASGSFWTRTPRGLRRRRFSELDLGQMASLAEEAGETERPALYRRLGDLALFLTGVFPDHTAGRSLGMVQVERLARVARMTSDEVLEALTGPGAALGTLALLEEMGRRWYRLAEEATVSLWGRSLWSMGDLAEGFRPARRTLNFLTDRYLYRFQADWFPPPAR